MARKSPKIEIEEIGGNQFADLAAVQARALNPLAASLARSIRRLLADGYLLEVDGQIIPNPERKK